MFTSFGTFWIAFGLTLQPQTGAYGNFSPDPSNPAAGLETVPFNASWGFFLLWMGVLCLVYTICALRTNLVFVGILGLLVPAFGCLAAAYWHLAEENMAAAASCQLAGGALAFVVCMLGWYIFTSIMLASLDFPFSLPGKPLSIYVATAFNHELTLLQSVIFPVSSRERPSGGARRRTNWQPRSFWIRA